MPAEPAARRGTVAAVFVFAAVLLAVAIGVLGARKHPVVLDTNRVDESEFVATVRDRPFCQHGELVPGGTVGVRLLIGTYGRPGPPLQLTLRAGAPSQRLVTEGRLSSGWSQGHVIVPVGRVQGPELATMCVRVTGNRPIAVAGRGRVRVEYLGGRESDLSRLSAIARHYGRGKSRWVGSWTLPLTALLVLTGLGLAARQMITEGRA